MAKKDKRLQRLLKGEATIRFAELDGVLRELGYTKRQSGKGSSHFVFSHPRVDRMVVLVSHGKNDNLPEYQVRQAIRSIKQLLEDV